MVSLLLGVLIKTNIHSKSLKSVQNIFENTKHWAFEEPFLTHEYHLTTHLVSVAELRQLVGVIERLSKDKHSQHVIIDTLLKKEALQFTRIQLSCLNQDLLRRSSLLRLQKLLLTHRELISDVFGPHVFVSHHTRDLLRLPLQTVQGLQSSDQVESWLRSRFVTCWINMWRFEPSAAPFFLHCLL